MMKKLMFTFIVVLLTLPVNAARTFTDSDLEIYMQDSTVESTERYRPERRKKETVRELNDNKQAKNKKESWCRKGEKYRDKVNSAQRDLDKAENRINQYRKALAVRKSDLRSAMRALKRSRERLEAVKEEYRNFEDRAYRQNIPRDWYECYYDGYDEYREY